MNVSQKKRIKFFKKKFKIKTSFGLSGFFFWNFIKIEAVYLKLLKRILKKNIKKKKKIYLQRKVWLNLNQNYPLSKKSKNSRMGKGKGSFLRWVVNIKPCICFVEFLGFNFFILNFLKKKFKICFRKDLDLFFYKKSLNIWSKSYKLKYINLTYKKFNF